MKDMICTDAYGSTVARAAFCRLRDGASPDARIPRGGGAPHTSLGTRAGFTLVEVIVVLVILAILMAVAVPALTGYIGKAQGQASAQALKTMHTALQTMATQDFANGYVKTSNAHNPSAEITYYGLSLQPIGTDQYFSVYIAYEKDAPDASFRHLLTYLGADEPPNFPSDCNQAQLRFLISPDTGRVVALDYVARDKTSGKIKLRVTWHFDGAKQKLSSAVSANLDDSGYTVRYLDGQLISGTTPAW